jgi:hypothetical protein
MFVIRSTSSDRELSFASKREDHFLVKLRGHNLEAALDVYAFDEASGLPAFFSELGAHTRPWVGAPSWSSLEGEFTIAATCSVSGHVLFKVELRGLVGTAEEWSLCVGIPSELGQLSAIARACQAFFFGAHA